MQGKTSLKPNDYFCVKYEKNMRRIVLLTGMLLLAGWLGAREMKIVTSDSVCLYINVRGTGTPCLYLHGGPGSGSLWLEEFMGDYLEKKFQMVYLDQRGVGRSSSPENGDYSMERMVKDFEEVRKALGIDTWLTLGHSFGGILQMGYVKACPEAHSGMIMINCTLCMQESFSGSWISKAHEILGKEQPDMSSATPAQLLEVMTGLIDSLNKRELFWKMAYTEEANQEIMNATYGKVSEWNSDFSNIALSVADYWSDFRQFAPQVKVPVLFFYGERDWMVGPNHYKGIKFPNALYISSPTGHMPFLESRGDLEKAIDKFLSDAECIYSIF